MRIGGRLCSAPPCIRRAAPYAGLGPWSGSLGGGECRNPCARPVTRPDARGPVAHSQRRCWWRCFRYRLSRAQSASRGRLPSRRQGAGERRGGEERHDGRREDWIPFGQSREIGRASCRERVESAGRGGGEEKRTVE